MPTDWHSTRWRKPRTTKRLRVRFRNGDVSRWTYTAEQLDWRDRGEPFDITHLRFEEGE